MMGLITTTRHATIIAANTSNIYIYIYIKGPIRTPSNNDCAVVEQAQRVLCVDMRPWTAVQNTFRERCIQLGMDAIVAYHIHAALSYTYTHTYTHTEFAHARTQTCKSFFYYKHVKSPVNRTH